MSNWLTRIFKGEKKYEPPSVRAIIKLNDFAKESGLTDDELKIIEIHNNGTVKRVKYCEEEVEVLREQGIPVLPEDIPENYDFISIETEGGFEAYRR